MKQWKWDGLAMTHSSRTFAGLAARAGRIVVMGCAAWMGGRAGFARSPGPLLRLPLEAFDYQPLPASVLNSGVSALTLHYVDGQHMLLTFSRRRLMARLPDDPPTDFDRNIDAVLLELPSGRVLARTSWRLHDARQYLWALPDGNFLMRERNRLVTMAPLRELGAGDAFGQRAFAASARSIGSVQLSPAGDLLTLQTMEHPREERERSPSPGTRAYAAGAAATAGEGGAEDDGREVQIDFFRVVTAGGAGAEVKAVHAGAIGARTLVMLPLDATGLLTEVDQGKAHWAFDFHHHDGKVDELSPFDSTCRPIPMMVSRSEFIAFGCRGGQDRRAMGGFNLRGEEMWEQSFLESFTHPELAFAPSAGRFALGRMVTGEAVESSAPLSAGAVSAENVSVYQTESGRVLLSMNLTPVLIAGQNFALSPDGQQLAVVNNGAIEIYPLPPVTEKERKAVHLAETLVPERSEAPIRLEAIQEKKSGAERAGTSLPAAVARVEQKVEKKVESVPVAVVGKPAAAGAASVGDAAAESTAVAPAPVATASGDGGASGDETGHRKPPTLYAPGEKPADGAKPNAQGSVPQ